MQLGLLGNILSRRAAIPPRRANNRADTLGQHLLPRDAAHPLRRVPRLLERPRRPRPLRLPYFRAHTGGTAATPSSTSSATASSSTPKTRAPPYEVLLGLLGRDLLNQRVQIRESAVNHTHLRLRAGLSPTPKTARSPPTPASIQPGSPPPDAPLQAARARKPLPRN